MATRMQQRRGTAQQWTSENPVLAEGEVGFETDTYQFKIGNGVNQWASLDYFSAGVDLSAYATESYVDTAVSNIVDSAPGVLDTLNEIAAAIGDDADFVTTINTTITNGDSATLTSAQNYADGLATNYDPAGSASTAETNANNYTDAEISSLDTSLKSYADQAETDAKSYADTQDQALSLTLTQAFENYTDGATTDMATTSYVDSQDGITLAAANQYTDDEIAAIPAPDLSSYATKAYADQAETDAISTASSDATTKANAAESNANSYTDSLIGDATVDGTSGNTVTNRIASAVSSLVDSAPGTLDTLNELAAALGDDPNFSATIMDLIGYKAPVVHTHPISDVTNLQSELDDKADTTYVDSEISGRAPLSHTHPISDVTNLQNELDGKSDTGHGHAISDVTNLQNTLDGKAASSHTHAISEVTNLQSSLDAKVNKTNPTVNAASETAYYVRNIYISSSDTPSGGNDGDLWVTWE